eukprot:8149583-Prorocentrum_lima.AAC.1
MKVPAFSKRDHAPPQAFTLVEEEPSLMLMPGNDFHAWVAGNESSIAGAVSYTHLRAHETRRHL